MDLWDRLRYWSNHIEYVAGLVDRWSPSGCASEKDCEDSLYNFLHKNLLDKQVIRQYGKGRSHVDLMVDDKVMIELKFKLSSTSEYQRLVGQLVDYGRWEKAFILVLVGETDRGMFKQLQKEIDERFPPTVVLEIIGRVIHKPLT